MLPPLIPENAPFTAAQRAWLNGFFAGLLAPGSNGNGTLAPTIALNSVAQSNGAAAVTTEEPEDFPWHDSSLSLDERMQLAAGKPLSRRLMAAMAQLDCGACGYLCQTYSEAIATGTEKDLTRCTPGGSDTAKKLKQLVSTEALAATAPSNGALNGTAVQTPVNGTATLAKPGYSRQNPFPAKLLEVTSLNGPGSDKDTRQVVFDLSAGGIEYLPGDSLGVMPRNCPETVAALLDRLNADADEPVTLHDGRKLTAGAALTEALTIHKVNDGVVSVLAGAARHRDEEQTLRGLLSEDPQDLLSQADLLELLERFPSIQLPIAELVGALTPLQPRLYSIASSLRAHPGQVHLTVGVVRYRRGERMRNGVCSTFLAERAPLGETVPVFIQTSHGFRLPADPTRDVVMVGPGTGIAPFRAFLQERAATGAAGRNWLFFGDQRGATDFLYRDELLAAKQGGTLHRLDTAWSREQNAKIYVQQRMREQGAELFAWLQNGAYFYVCGDAKRMAPDVDAALVDVVATHGGLSSEEAKQYVRKLSKEKRYLRDVY